jgi:GT2 family glycosyltransferase
MASTLAVVITSYSLERKQDVCDVLTSLARQDEAADEVFFVAEGPQELQMAIEAHAAALRMRGFRSLRNDGHQGLSAARNVAIKASNADLIAFLDDDAVAEPGWSAAVRAAFAVDEVVIGVTGSVQPLWMESSANWLPTEMYWLIGCTDFTGWNTRRRVRWAWGVNMAFRRKAIELAGLFSIGTGYTAGARHQPWGDDLEFSLRARRTTGGTIWFEPEMRVRHKVYACRVSPRFAAARARQIGASQRLARRVYPELANHQFETSVGLRIAGMVLRSLALLPLHPLGSQRRVRIGTIALISALLGFLNPSAALESARTRR